AVVLPGHTDHGLNGGRGCSLHEAAHVLLSHQPGLDVDADPVEARPGHNLGGEGPGNDAPSAESGLAAVEDLSQHHRARVNRRTKLVPIDWGSTRRSRGI